MMNESKKETAFFNDTNEKYSYNKTIIELFEDQAERYPDSPAIITDTRVYTYGEFNLWTNQIAHFLRKNGVGNNDIVGIMIERSIEMLAGIFAIIKAGGAYLPIDPYYPEFRKNELIKDSSANLILVSDEGFESGIDGPQFLNINNEKVRLEPGCNLKKINQPEDIVYVIYTSGSTGRPKGVMIMHHSLVNRIEWMQKCYPSDRDTVFIQKTVYTFDVSVWELFWWSVSGARIFILQPKKEHDPRHLCRVINKYKISFLHFVPSVLRIFLDYIEVKNNQRDLQSMRKVFVSGERLDSSLVKRFYTLFDENKDIELINLYGPTEATIDVTYFNCKKGVEYDEVPIGKPIDNTRIYIVGKDNNQVPVGEAGEIYIAGAGLAKCYLNRTELTSERFPLFNGERVYKTGDIGKYLDDGNILFLGRMDNQIKLRGLRIELEEIEFYLLKHQDVKEAVVLMKKDSMGNKYLCAYLVVKKPVASQSLKLFLSRFLPEYMVPSVITLLEEMPIKPNGKIDRSALQDLLLPGIV
jgi:amino acid adenylation domain-containing protein